MWSVSLIAKVSSPSLDCLDILSECLRLMRLWIFLIYLYEHAWKECKYVTGLEWWWWWCTELPPSVMDLFQRKLKLALFHSCICWQSAFLPFLSASMLWCSLSNISLFLWRLLINVALTVDVWLWMLFDSVVPSCLSMCSHGDTQQHNGTPDLSTIYYNWKLSEIIIQKPTYNHFTALVWNSWWKTPFN